MRNTLKIGKNFVWSLTAILLLTACTEKFGTEKSTSAWKMQVIPGQIETRGSVETEFKTGDRFGIYIVNRTTTDIPSPLTLAEGNWTDNLGNLLKKDGSWECDLPLYWKDKETKVDAYAYYPWTETPPNADVNRWPIRVAKDQSTEDSIRISDFLWGKTAGASYATDNGRLTLNFSHRLSKLNITVKVTANGNVVKAKVASIKLSGLQIAGICDLNTGEITVSPGNTEEMKPYQNPVQPHKAEILIIPQTVEAGKLMTVVLNDAKVLKAYDYRLTSPVTFESGKTYDIGLVYTVDGWLDLDYRKIVFPWNGGSVFKGYSGEHYDEHISHLNISTNMDWQASVNTEAKDWCILTRENDQLSVNLVTSNETGLERTAYITIKAGDKTEQIEVVQEKPYFNVYPEALTFEAGADTKTIGITSELQWDYHLNGGENWCHLQKDESGLTLRADENRTTENRTAVITISAGEMTRNVTVEQKTYRIDITGELQDFSYLGNSQNVWISSVLPWKAYARDNWCKLGSWEGDQSWTPSTVHQGDAAMYISLDKNTTTSPRTTVIFVTNDIITRELTVTQQPATIRVIPSTLSFGVNGGEEKVIVETTVGDYTYTSSQPSWCTVKKDIFGGGLKITVLPNPTGATRSATVTCMTFEGGPSCTLEVTQSK